jgi:hypothetical protein
VGLTTYRMLRKEPSNLVSAERWRVPTTDRLVDNSHFVRCGICELTLGRTRPRGFLRILNMPGNIGQRRPESESPPVGFPMRDVKFASQKSKG